MALSMASALSNHSSPIPSGLPSFLAPIGWFWIHLFKPGIFRTTEVCWCPLHSAMLWSWVRPVLLNRMNTSFAPVVMMIFPPCFLDFLVPAFDGEVGVQVWRAAADHILRLAASTGHNRRRLQSR